MGMRRWCTAAVLLLSAVGFAHAGPATPVPAAAAVAAPDHDLALEAVTRAKEAAYRDVLARFDAAESSAGVASTIARCRFIGHYAQEDYGDWIASAHDDHEACLERLRQRWAHTREAQLYLFQQMWGEDAAAKGDLLIEQAAAWPAPLRADLYATQGRVLEGLRLDEKAAEMTLRAARLGHADSVPHAMETLLARQDEAGATGLLRGSPAAVDAWRADKRLAAALKIRDARVALAELKRYDGRDLDLDAVLVARTHLNAGDVAAAHRTLQAAGAGDDEARARFDVALAKADIPAAVAQISMTGIDGMADNLERFAVLASRYPASLFTLPMLSMALVWGAVLLGLALLPMALLVPVHYRGLGRRVHGRAPVPLFPRVGLRHAWWGMSLMMALPFLVAGMIEPGTVAGLFVGDDGSDGNAFARIQLWTSAACLVLLVPVSWRLGRDAVGGRIAWRRQLAWLLFALAMLYLVIYLQGAWLQWRAEDTRTEQTEAIERLLAGGQAVYGPMLTFFLVAVLGPIVEELVFRGLLLGGMARHISFGGSNLLQALLFATVHNDPPRFFVYFAMGLLGGMLVRRTGSLLPAIVLHAINNGIFFVLAT